MLDARIKSLVEFAKRKHPELFAVNNNDIIAGKGRHGETGYW